MSSSSTGSGGNAIQFKIGLEGKPQKALDVIAYVFDKGTGKLIASSPLREGNLQLNLDERQAAMSRIFLAPSIPKEKGTRPSIKTMEGLHAYEPVWTYNPKQHAYELAQIPEYYWKWWDWCVCRIRGRVLKPVTVNGVTTNMPVCHARVHICEVDPFWIIFRQLPDSIIDRLRQEIVAVIDKPIPWPPIGPDPGPEFRFDPGFIDPSPENIAQAQRMQMDRLKRSGVSSSSFASPLSEATTASLSREKLFSEMGGMAGSVQPSANLETIRDSSKLFMANPQSRALESLGQKQQILKASLASQSIVAVRDALIQNIDIIRPYFCWWDWFWPFLRCSEIAVVETNNQGLFDIPTWYLCNGDKPDLYFWVEYCIGGVWTTVYRPPISCNTYWNYACGSEVTIRVYDPRVSWCGDLPTLPGNGIAVLSVGRNVNVSQIPQTGTNTGLAPDASPFGGSLEPHILFGDGLAAGGITHYKWSYRRTTGGDSWHAMDNQVIRHYLENKPNPPGGFVAKTYLLGPDPAIVGETVFQVPPINPPSGPGNWAPAVDPRTDTASGYFMTHLLAGGNADLADGLYELKLEVFNGATRKDVPDNFFQVPLATINGPFLDQVVDFMNAPESNLIRDPATLKVTAYKLLIYVDNNSCEAAIHNVELGGTPVDPCGFLNYSSDGQTLHVAYKAKQKNNHATFSFVIVRGSIGAVDSAAGSVGIGVSNGYTRDASSIFSKDVLISYLLRAIGGNPACIRAAFAESLYVAATATDGWSRLSYLDASDLKAFALSPP
jgi:hypothetical protein